MTGAPIQWPCMTGAPMQWPCMTGVSMCMTDAHIDIGDIIGTQTDPRRSNCPHLVYMGLTGCHGQFFPRPDHINQHLSADELTTGRLLVWQQCQWCNFSQRTWLFYVASLYSGISEGGRCQGACRLQMFFYNPIQRYNRHFMWSAKPHVESQVLTIL